MMKVSAAPKLQNLGRLDCVVTFSTLQDSVKKLSIIIKFTKHNLPETEVSAATFTRQLLNKKDWERH